MCSIKFSIKKVVSDILGLVDFAVRLVNSVFNKPNGQVKFSWENSNYRNTEVNPPHQKFSWGS